MTPPTFSSFQNALSQNTWWSYLLLVATLLAVTLIFHRLSWWIAGRIVRLNRISRRGRTLSPERLRTVQALLANSISFVALSVAAVVALARLAGVANVIWMIGLFGAAFGIGASQHIRDLLTGVSFMFEDSLAVGEKVEVAGISGVVEAVHLRTTLMRSPTGELYTVPNGDIRLIRNFSRGRYSMIEMTLKLASADLSRALSVLDDLGKETLNSEPDLLEPWQILTESGVLAQTTDLKLLARARWGRGAEMRPHLLALIHQRLAEAGVEMAN